MPADIEDLLERLDNIDIHLDTLLAHADEQADAQHLIADTLERITHRLNVIVARYLPNESPTDQPPKESHR